NEAHRNQLGDLLDADTRFRQQIRYRDGEIAAHRSKRKDEDETDDRVGAARVAHSSASLHRMACIRLLAGFGGMRIIGDRVIRRTEGRRLDCAPQGTSMPIASARVALSRVFFQRCFYLFVVLVALLILSPLVTES